MLRVLGSDKRFCDGISRRDALWAGGLSLFGLSLGDYLRAEGRHAASGGCVVWQGQVVHPALPLWLAESARTRGHEAERAGRSSRRTQADPLHSSGLRRLRIDAERGPHHGPRHGRAFGDAQVPDPRRRLRDNRHPRDRRGDGVESARRPALAVRWIGRGVPGRTEEEA